MTCTGNCNQGRDCTCADQPRKPPKRSDLFWIMVLELASFAILCIAALVGGRIAGMW